MRKTSRASFRPRRAAAASLENGYKHQRGFRQRIIVAASYRRYDRKPDRRISRCARSISAGVVSDACPGDQRASFPRDTSAHHCRIILESSLTKVFAFPARVAFDLFRRRNRGRRIDGNSRWLPCGGMCYMRIVSNTFWPGTGFGRLRLRSVFSRRKFMP